ncbi:hypothetical protein CHLRE_13g583898v5 [Chlamydomonas reinhardtii]|uniref:CxC3 like cysteine cluster domain-containing protein n=1 Tax=Chlamydomonas reinhardtii TaxID=3055 RepID=A0A2K3D0K1_CHLRE|nr:uncharacterized protein CHLRE_13g583898v5 [Chlamydomonas reinhardtii]PNW74064.1 hypothetical protein CHLRE_13g583898v5 [Chlamydomonas reinhardtii]
MKEWKDIYKKQDDEEGAAYVQHAAPHTLPDVDSDTLSSDPADSSDDDGEGAGGAEPRGQETKYPLPYDSSAVVEDFFRSVTAADKVCSELRTATQKVLQCSADFEAASTACPVCGKPGDPKGMPPFKVTVVTWDQPVSIDVPHVTCSSCMRGYTLRPTVLGCLPDTIVSWDLLRQRDGNVILWWQTSLLQQFTSLQYYNGHLGMDRFCAALMANWQENGCDSQGLTLTQLRQRLSSTSQRYRFLRGLVEDLPEQLPGWPAGALNACACCGDAEGWHGTGAGSSSGGGGGGAAGGATTAAAPLADLAHRARGQDGPVAEAAAPDAPSAGAGMGSSSGGGGGGAAGDATTAAAPLADLAHRARGQDGPVAKAAAPGAPSAGAGMGSSSGGGGGGAAGGATTAAAPLADLAHRARGQDGPVAEAAAPGAPSAGAGMGSSSGGGGGGAAGSGGASPSLGFAWRPMLAAAEPAGRGPPIFHTGAFDCNFKLSLFKKKGLTHKYGLDYRQLSRRRYTLGNAYVRGFEPPKGSADVGRNADCSSFTADKVLAKEEAGKLVTAAGVVLCRHGMLLRLVNLFHGERHMYATAAAASILAAGTAVQFWWYDIACRWSKSWQKWHQALDPSTAWLGVAAAMVSLVPPFHSYAHSYECQKTFGHQGQTGAGRGTGEIVEIFNSQVGKQGKVLRYTSPAHRESVLEDVGRRYCRQVELGLPARVYRMRLRAQAAHDAAQDRIETLEATLTPQQVEMACAGHAAQRSQQRHDQPKRHANADAVAGEPGWKAVYARCRLALMKLQRLDTVDNPADPVPLSVLVAGGDNLTLRQRPALIKQLEEEKKKLEQEHAAAAPPPREWEADSAAFKEAVSDLAESEIKKITSEIEVE